MVRPTYDLEPLAADGFGSEWSNHNGDLELGRDVPAPRFIETDSPATGRSDRSLPSDHRTTSVVFVYETDSVTPEYNDVMWNSQDYVGTVRMEIVVTSEVDGIEPGDHRDAIIRTFEDIREANAAPSGGVFGSSYRAMKVTNIDRDPTRFSNQHRAYYDVEFEALGVI